MGFKIVWLAFQGLDKAQLLERLGMTDTGEPDEVCEAPFSLCEGPTGWMILFANDFGFGDKAQIAALSADSRVLLCRIHEGLMFSRAALYENGAQTWAVTHDAQEGLHDLHISGAPPEPLDAIRERLTGAQNADETGEVDFIFDIPVELAQSLTGYRHDVYAPETWAFTRLHRSAPTSTKGSSADLMGRLKGLLSRRG
jgi:hypothetical protein